MYADFALVYDRLMAEVDYEAWARHYQTLLARNGVAEGAFVLEAACGTGNLSLPLARHYRLQPSDRSPEMLSVAAAKAKAKKAARTRTARWSPRPLPPATSPGPSPASPCSTRAPPDHPPPSRCAAGGLRTGTPQVKERRRAG